MADVDIVLVQPLENGGVMEANDYQVTVDVLLNRAKRAERKSIVFMFILAGISAATILIILYVLFTRNASAGPSTGRYVEYFFGEMMKAQFKPEEITSVAAKLADLTKTDYTQLLVSSIFSLGTVGFTVLLIQIMGNFIRYYARVAELYYSQADAIRISRGDVAIASEYSKILSPAGVDFGKAPISIYEKALDAVSNFARTTKK
jgi:hypothetical protein